MLNAWHGDWTALSLVSIAYHGACGNTLIEQPRAIPGNYRVIARGCGSVCPDLSSHVHVCSYCEIYLSLYLSITLSLYHSIDLYIYISMTMSKHEHTVVVHFTHFVFSTCESGIYVELSWWWWWWSCYYVVGCIFNIYIVVHLTLSFMWLLCIVCACSFVVSFAHHSICVPLAFSWFLSGDLSPSFTTTT
jgi:hypothetical protein